MSGPPRVVLDTNVVLLTLLFSSRRLAGFLLPFRRSPRLEIVTPAQLLQVIAQGGR